MSSPLKQMIVPIVIVGAVIFAIGVRHSVQLNPEASMSIFVNNESPEETIIDPLIRAGDSVLPLITRHIENRNSIRRGYGILFLGNTGRASVRPMLISILEDQTETVEFRADALHALALSDKELGTTYAKRFEQDDSALGIIASEILSGQIGPENRRTIWDTMGTQMN